MSEKSKIQWTDATLNVVVGCEQVSPGCDNCYAKYLVDVRQSKNPRSPRFGIPFETLTFHPERLRMLNVRKPTRFFVNSMSDLFHRGISDDFILDVFKAMAAKTFCPYRHTFQILTKRPERMRRLMPKIWPEIEDNAGGHSLEVVQNGIWLGVSIESNDYAWRAEMLRETPAGVRFISFEPLLGRVDKVWLDRIDWVICGGESGDGWRPMDVAWARELRDVSRLHGAAFFMKQMAAYRPTDDLIPTDLLIREYPKGNV